MRIVPYERLEPDWGIPYSREHLARLGKAGKFPKPIKLGDNGRIGWIDEELEKHMRERAAARNAA